MDTFIYTSMRVQDEKMSRRIKTDLFQKRYKRLGIEFSKFYSDSLFFNSKPHQGNICAQNLCQ